MDTKNQEERKALNLRLTPELYRQVEELAKEEALLPGPYARRILAKHTAQEMKRRARQQEQDQAHAS